MKICLHDILLHRCNSLRAKARKWQEGDTLQDMKEHAKEVRKTGIFKVKKKTKHNT